jgi:prepilin signal peptidase PulO-like enzyme (type II secretory pathway)
LFLELSNLLELVYLAFIFAGFQFFAYWLKAKKVQNVPFVPALFFSFIMVCYLDIKPSAYLLLHF